MNKTKIQKQKTKIFYKKRQKDQHWNRKKTKTKKNEEKRPTLKK